MKKKLVFDIMLNERYICTLRMPISFDMIEEMDEMGGSSKRRNTSEIY